jgi:hypothetical protein
MPKVLSRISTIRGERWRDIPSFESYYQVSNLGRVKSLYRQDRLGREHPEGELKQIWDGRYFGVKLSVDGEVKSVRVHQLVLLAFRGPPQKGQECRHKDDDQANNRLSNLRYGSSLQNSQDQRKNKGFRYALDHQNGLLSDQQIAEIHLLPAGTIKAWAERHHVSKGHVYNIRAGCRRANKKD